MDRIIYTSMTGANAAAHRQAVLANNLANASTNGFRAEMSTFRSVPVQGEGSTTRVFALEATSGHSQASGPVQRTGRSLDAMAMGNAWFGVQGLDGTEAYTRNGSFEVAQDGQLRTGTGLAVLSDGGAPIDVPPGRRTLAGLRRHADRQDRQASRRPCSGASSSPRPRPTIRCAAATTGCFAPPRATPLPQDANARLLAGAVEGSNVNAVESMVGMIAAARQFEQQMKLLQTAETNDKSASQLLSLNG